MSRFLVDHSSLTNNLWFSITGSSISWGSGYDKVPLEDFEVTIHDDLKYVTLHLKEQDINLCDIDGKKDFEMVALVLQHFKKMI